MPKYLVTGGAGFIGSHLADALIEYGNQVRVLDDLSTGSIEHLHPNAELMVGCVSDRSAVAHAMDGIDGCFHLAAVSSVERSRIHLLETHRINAGGLLTILETVSRLNNKIPIVYASSAAVYGNPQCMPICEGDKLDPINTYGADKLSCELHARACGVVHGISSFGLRLFNVYGSRQNPHSPYSGVISIFMERVLHGGDITIHGDGGQKRDFVHVDDVVRAFISAMARAAISGPIANVSTGIPVTILQLAETLRDLARNVCDKSGELRYDDARVGDIRNSCGDTSHAESILNWRPQIDLYSGLMSLMNSFLNVEKKHHR
ncbi:MAG: NAD-dependent epimerase/dehydratase family protein [Alphaproteobacteria bacterium]|nr:NAD-dependent epimerase/dehydratase family protein [Alphaproteobacteria bacterium]